MENSFIRELYKQFPLVEVELEDGAAFVEEKEVEVNDYLVVISYNVFAEVLSVQATYEHPAYEEIGTPECTLELIEVYKDGELVEMEPDKNQITLIEVILARNTVIR